MTTANLNGSTCVMTVSDEESPVYLRNFGNVLHLVDASGKPIGQQESVDVGVFASECVQRVTVTLAHQGFWHEGLVQVAGKATAVEIKEGLRRCSAARTGYYSARLNSGVTDRDELIEGIVCLRKEVFEQIDLIRTRAEDTDALLSKWDRAGAPAASGGGGQGIIHKIEATTAQLHDELKVGVLSGRFIPSQEQVAAMRVVAKLVNAGAIDLFDDQYVPGGGRVFRALKIGAGMKSAQGVNAEPVSEPEQVTAIQGEAVSFSLDPLEQAVESTVRMLRDEHQQMADTGAKQDSALCDRLGTHLDALLAIQLEQVSSHEHH